MMWWVTPFAVVLVAILGVSNAAEDPDVRQVIEGGSNQVPKAGPVRVVYLIDFLGRPAGQVNVPEQRKEGGVALAHPIADDDTLPDGVYFRPENGKPVDESTVSSNGIM